MYKSFRGLFVLILGFAAPLIMGFLNVAQEPLTRNMLASCSTERLVEEHASFLRRHTLRRFVDDAQFVTNAMAARDPDLQEGVNA
jgi:hypothetical protein